MSENRGTDDRGALAGGCLLVLLLVCGWIASLTINQGGVQRGTGRDAEVLTWHGWESADSTGNTAALDQEGPANPPAVPAPMPASTALPVLAQAPAPTAAFPVYRAESQALPLSKQDSAEEGTSVKEEGGVAREIGAIGPWTVLGWVLLIVLPIVGFAALGIWAYRVLSLTAAQRAAILRGATSPEPASPMPLGGAATVQPASVSGAPTCGQKSQPALEPIPAAPREPAEENASPGADNAAAPEAPELVIDIEEFLARMGIEAEAPS